MPTNEYKSRIPKLIPTATGAVMWIDEMHKKGLLYHFDDQPSSIISSKTGEQLFTTQECRELEALRPYLFAIDGICPFELSLALVEPELLESGYTDTLVSRDT